MTTVPDPTSAAGATNAPESARSAIGSGNGGSGDLRAGSSWAAVEALAALLEPEAFDPDQPADETWREATRERALGHAAKVITSDYRRVVEDDATIERLAKAVLAVNRTFKYRQADVLARAVVRALREET